MVAPSLATTPPSEPHQRQPLYRVPRHFTFKKRRRPGPPLSALSRAAGVVAESAAAAAATVMRVLGAVAAVSTRVSSVVAPPLVGALTAATAHAASTAVSAVARLARHATQLRRERDAPTPPPVAARVALRRQRSDHHADLQPQRLFRWGDIGQGPHAVAPHADVVASTPHAVPSRVSSSSQESASSSVLGAPRSTSTSLAACVSTSREASSASRAPSLAASEQRAASLHPTPVNAASVPARHSQSAAAAASSAWRQQQQTPAVAFTTARGNVALGSAAPPNALQASPRPGSPQHDPSLRLDFDSEQRAGALPSSPDAPHVVNSYSISAQRPAAPMAR